MRNKKLAWNTISGLLLQVTTVLCGFVLPRAILNRFGSDVNGLLNSISQFLQMIAFLELGVGAVIRSALYKPLADGDTVKVSEVLVSGNRFFRKIGLMLVLYVAALMVIFPTWIDDTFGFTYVATLIFAMSVSYFTRYYFGLVDRLLLDADQKAYIVNLIDMATLVFNTVFCYCLLYLGFSVQVVKLTTSGIFLLRPILARIYIRKNYQIDRKCQYTKDPVEQKKNGIAQHIAAIVLDSTDIVVLSVFSDMYAVSVYSVYLIVVSGIKSLVLSLLGGVGSLFGELWAKQEREELNRYFGFTEWIVHGLALFVWCCTYKLIVPFVLIYTEHMGDVNYNEPVFAALICIAYVLYCLRLPFNEMILAAGHYKNTQKIYIVGAVINVVLSILAVYSLGLIGVALGTIAAMLYQLLHMGYYVVGHLKVHSFFGTIKQYVIDGITIALILSATSVIPPTEASWMGWIVLSVQHAIVIAVCILTVNLVFYHKASMQIFHKVMKKH